MAQDDPNAARSERVPDPITDTLLASLRAARLRAKLLEADIEAIGISLRYGLISPRQALIAMQDLGIYNVFDVGTRPGDAWQTLPETPAVSHDAG